MSVVIVEQTLVRSAGEMAGVAAMLRAKVRAYVHSWTGEEHLPERVRVAVAAQQGASEIIIGWVQALAVLAFGIIYALAPKAFPPDIPFEPVPVTLAAYGCFIAVRLWLSYRGRLSGVLIAISIVVDMMVLMITIWSFHLQYRGPPALYLKAPTLMYVFILISLRTLRFQPIYVILSGMAAATGWAALVGYALLAGSAHVTHSYAEYVTSYSVLLGAEMDKIISIISVTAILSISIVRARKLLQDTTAERAAIGDLSRFFAPEVAALIISSESLASGQGERRDSAILIVDLRAFTSLSHGRSASALIALLHDYHSRFVPIIRRHGGRVDKYLGDGILASFGAVATSPTYAADGCRAVAEIAREAHVWALGRKSRGLDAPALGISLVSGGIIFGTVGDATRLEYTVIGEVVNLAAKLEKHTKTERVMALTTRETYDLALRQGWEPHQVEFRRGIVDGIDQPLDLVVLDFAAASEVILP